jgi:hypothetical protein
MVDIKDDIPKLRADLELIPTIYQGEQAVIIRDFLGLIKKPVILQGEALKLIGFIDGKNSIQDIQLGLVRQGGGVFVSRESVERILVELDAAFLLDSKRAAAQKKRFIEEYSRIEVRKASHAGQAYPASKEKLASYIDSILKTAGESPAEDNGKEVCALISPHIDLEAGKRTYAKAYGSLKNSSPRKIILLGTGHGLEDGFFSLTEKDFATPFGLARTDKEIVRKLREAGEKIVCADDLAHRQEHSLEFQLVFLQHLFGAELSIVPVLCGSFRHELLRVSRPSQISGVDMFLGVLADTLANLGAEALIVAGVDFSHIGPKFGHRHVAASLLVETKKHDRALIEACLNEDVEAFWAESRRVKDEFNVCGFSALACLLEILPPADGRLLDYDFWMEEPTRSAVSFAALAFATRR